MGLHSCGGGRQYTDTLINYIVCMTRWKVKQGRRNEGSLVWILVWPFTSCEILGM